MKLLRNLPGPLFAWDVWAENYQSGNNISRVYSQRDQRYVCRRRNAHLSILRFLFSTSPFHLTYLFSTSHYITIPQLAYTWFQPLLNLTITHLTSPYLNISYLTGPYLKTPHSTSPHPTPYHSIPSCVQPFPGDTSPRLCRLQGSYLLRPRSPGDL